MTKEEKIIETSIKLFNEDGFHGTSTSRIAKTAGVANGTLFQYFPTKENLVVSAFISIKDELLEFLAEEEPGKSNIKQVLKSQFVRSLVWALDHRAKFDFLQQFHTSPYLTKVDNSSLKKYSESHLQVINKAKDEEVIQPLSTDLIYGLVSSHTYGLYQFISSQELTKYEQHELIEKGFKLLWKMLT